MQGPVGLITYNIFHDAVYVAEGCICQHIDFEFCMFGATYGIFFFDIEDLQFLIYVSRQEGFKCSITSFL